MKLAYLNSEYPSLSHTFIEREVRALRGLGVSIRTYSVRPTGRNGRIGAAHQSAAEETVVVQSGAWALVKDFVLGVLRSPSGVWRAMTAAQRLSPPGIGFRLRHAAYVVQGIRLARQLDAAEIRHVHVHMANNGAAIAMMACTFDPRLSYSLSIHGSAEFFHVDTWTLQGKAERAVFVRCISNFCRAQVMAWTSPAAWGRFQVVHCGVDAAEFSPRPARSPGPLRLVTVGRLHSIKAYPVLLDACAILKDGGVAFELEMVGDGPMRPELEGQIQRLGLGAHVRLVGAVAAERLGEYMNRADAMVISSFMEGVPVVLMEAMATELGVISTRVGGIAELVEDGVSGLLVDPSSAPALARAITVYASNPDVCRNHGAAGRRRVLAGYQINQTAEGMAALFRGHLPAPDENLRASRGSSLEFASTTGQSGATDVCNPA